MTRRKVILPYWTPSKEEVLNKEALKNKFGDLSQGELIINNNTEGSYLTILDSNDNPSTFDSSKIIDKKISESILATSAYTDAQIAVVQGEIDAIEKDVTGLTTSLTELSSNVETEIERLEGDIATSKSEAISAASAFTLEQIKKVSDVNDGLSEKVEELESSAATLSTSLAKLSSATSAFSGTVVSEIRRLDGRVDGAFTSAITYTENNLKDYATQSFVTDKIVSALTNGTIDLTGYATEEWVKGKIQDKLNNLGLVNITYLELVNLRKNSQLISGQQYRITDYTTTTVQKNTQTAEHQFDIIVTADDVNVLNENARAIQHTNDVDDYFHNSDLAAWVLKYCLDNDASRFAWADATNGKGVIYYMKDEWNNECPYDFKSIQFYNSNWDTYVYTFTWIDENYEVIDTSVFGNNGTLTSFSEIDGVYGNIIKPYIEQIWDEEIGGYLGTKQLLNNITFISDYEYQSNGNDGFMGCYSNSFGNDCHDNTFGNSCGNNSFGNSCYNNRFGHNCSYNSFGKACHDNNFGESKDNLNSYYRYIIFDNGNSYINLNCTSTTSSTNYYQNVRIGLGVNNKTINDSNVGQIHETLYKPTNSQTITI